MRWASVRRFAGWVRCLGGLAAIPATAQPGSDMLALFSLPELGRGMVASVADGATLVLADGTGVRLAGIEPPLAAPGAQSRWEDAARTQLEALVAGHSVTLRAAPAAPDRYGRVTAQLVRDDGLWLEGVLVAAGAVRVQPPAPGLSAALLRREARARQLHLGLWQAPFYAVRHAAELDHASGRYVIVEARILRVDERNGVVVLDLDGQAEARLDRPARRLFAQAGLDPADFAGKQLRLRGWVRWQGRPVLDLTSPEAVETDTSDLPSG